MKKYTIETLSKCKYNRDGTLSKAEVMLIMILFHDSGYRCLKHFYTEHVCKHLRHLFPRVVSYNRCVDSTALRVCKLCSNLISSNSRYIIKSLQIYYIFHTLSANRCKKR